LLTHRVAYRPDQPETECILDVLRAVAPDEPSRPYDSRPALCLTDSEHARGRAILAEKGASFSLLIGVQPGANYAAKQWEARKFAQVAEALATENPGAAIVLLGKGKTEADAARALRHALPPTVNVIDLTDATGLRETMAVLGQLRLFIGNDTGVNHLAAALGVPTVGLFGPTSAQKWGNTARIGVVVAAPDGDLGGLSVAPVLDAARLLLSCPPPSPVLVGVPV
jgi:ADP-heptose:LPS heptosyltransferase